MSVVKPCINYDFRLYHGYIFGTAAAAISSMSYDHPEEWNSISKKPICDSRKTSEKSEPL